MSLPSIAIIDFSSRSDREVQDALRAVNRQIVEDFMPIWGGGRMLKLHASSFNPDDPDSLTEEAVNADSVIYILDQPHIPGALGYHSINTSEIPVGFVFEDLGDWTVTLSHEALELIIDPTVNVFVPGPHPQSPGNWVFHAYEVCDAVERTTYSIDGIEVSNFVTPQYFREGDAAGTRNDFLGVGVDSFGVTPGSHLGVINPNTWDFEIILGHQMPTKAAFARRQEAFYHERPERPEEKIAAALCQYNERPVRGCKKLPQLKGMTRKSRYEAAAAAMKPRK